MSIIFCSFSLLKIKISKRDISNSASFVHLCKNWSSIPVPTPDSRFRARLNSLKQGNPLDSSCKISIQIHVATTDSHLEQLRPICTVLPSNCSTELGNKRQMGHTRVFCDTGRDKTLVFTIPITFNLGHPAWSLSIFSMRKPVEKRQWLISSVSKLEQFSCEENKTKKVIAVVPEPMKFQLIQNRARRSPNFWHEVTSFHKSSTYGDFFQHDRKTSESVVGQVQFLQFFGAFLCNVAQTWRWHSLWLQERRNTWKTRNFSSQLWISCNISSQLEVPFFLHLNHLKVWSCSLFLQLFSLSNNPFRFWKLKINK